MKKVNALILTVFGLSFTCAQVGIGISEPMSSLHLEMSNERNKAFIITNSNDENFITNFKNGSIGINALPDGDLIKVNPSVTNPSMPTLQLIQMKNFDTYNTIETDKVFGYRQGRVDLKTSVSRNYNFVSKTTTTGPVGGSTIIEDAELVLDLQPGVYEILTSVIYSAGSDEDIVIGIKSSKNMSLSYFMGAGHYAEFNNSSGSLPFITKNITTTDNVVPFGGAGKDIKLVARIEGMIETTEALTIRVIYKQQATRTITSNSATVFGESFLFAKKIN